MVERLLTPNEVVEQKYSKHGVVVFIFNEHGEVLALKEKTSKPETGKIPGQIGVLCETSEKGEMWDETVIRGLREELGIDRNNVERIFQFEESRSYIGESIFIPGVLARVVKLSCRGSELLEVAKSGEEIEILGFMSIEEILSGDSRLGVLNVIYDAKDELDSK